MKPDWDELGEEFENSKKVLIGDVDCTVEASKKLCEDQGVKGYPTLKYYVPGGDPMGESYEGSRELAEMKKFAKTLGPSCSPKHLSKCSDEQKAELEGYMALSEEELDARITEAQSIIKEAEGKHEALMKQLQAQYQESQAAVDQVKAARKPSITLMNAAKLKPEPKEEATKKEL